VPVGDRAALAEAMVAISTGRRAVAAAALCPSRETRRSTTTCVDRELRMTNRIRRALIFVFALYSRRKRRRVATSAGRPVPSPWARAGCGGNHRSVKRLHLLHVAMLLFVIWAGFEFMVSQLGSAPQEVLEVRSALSGVVDDLGTRPVLAAATRTADGLRIRGICRDVQRYLVSPGGGERAALGTTDQRLAMTTLALPMA
jgi:hypothetical protein